VATWGTSSQIPTINDDVFLEGNIVRIDSTSINSAVARTIQNRALSPNTALNGTTPHIYPGIKVSASAGSGYVNVTTGSTTINITSSIIYSGQGTTSTGTITITTGSATTIINISGSIDNTFASTNGTAIFSNVRITCSVNGNIYTTKNVTGAYGIWFNTSTTANSLLNITGSITHKTSLQTADSYALYMQGTIGGKLNISGNIINDSYTTTTILASNANSAFITITGSIYQNNRSSVIFLTNTAANPITCSINGDVYSNGYASFGFSALYFTGGTQTVLLNINGNLYDNIAYYNTVIGGTSTLVRFFHSGSRTINTTNFSQATLNPPGTILSPGSGLPITSSVRSGSKYGSSLEYSGSMVVPSANNVRYLTLVDTGSGLVYVPETGSVRSSVTSSQTNNVNSTGSIIIPSSSNVLTGIIFNTGSVGTYASIDQYWNTSSAVVSQTDSIGYVLSSSLNVPFGSITGSIMSDLSNLNTTSNTVKRMQNIATTSSTNYQFSSSIS
jgi:hypothetical protein